MSSDQNPRSRLSPFAEETRRRGIDYWIPGIDLVKTYQRPWLLKDIGAGIVLTMILVPVGMGYAEASGLPAITGLYATMVALIAYALFGGSRILVIGPDSALVAIIAATILPLAANDSARAIELAGLLAILSGLLCMLAGLLKLGFITDLLSKPVRFGYMNAIALTLMVSQIPILLGFRAVGIDLISATTNLVKDIATGQVHTVASAIGIGCLATILAFKRFFPKLPGMLFAVLAATLIVVFFDLADATKLSVVGHVPRGLPAFGLPQLPQGEWAVLMTSAVAIALVSFADLSVVSRTFCEKGEEVDDNQELVALGLANIAAGCAQGFSVTASATRTPVAKGAGAKTQVTGITGAICIGLLLVVAPTIFNHVPSAALAAVVITACLSLIEVRGVVRLFKLRKSDFLASVACFLGVAFLGVVQGIFIAVGLALFIFILRASRPYHVVLGRVPELKGYHDITRHPEAKQIPGLVIFRWDAPLFFANSREFRQSVLKAVSEAPERVNRVLVEAEPVTDIDTTAADALEELERELLGAGIELSFANVKGPVKDQLKSYGLFDMIGTDKFFPTVGQAVNDYLDAYKVEWHDWTDEDCCDQAPHPGPCPGDASDS